MKLLDLGTLLRENAYPGRGIIVGKNRTGDKALMAYFIMGRSQNSRNRIFVETEDGIRTQAFDPSKMTDPSLIIYHPVRELEELTIVTNGDQTETLYDLLDSGGEFEEALRTRTFEPDPPNYTPRISALVTRLEGEFQLQMSILKSADGDGDHVQRYFFDYPSLPAGEGRFLHTYRCDGDPIPSFEGEPERVALPEELDPFTALVWDNLNPENKVSLFTRSIDLASGETQSRIVNRNQ